MRLGGVVAMLACAACSESGGLASLRIHVERDPASATPAYVLLSAYAGRPGAGFRDQRIEGALPADSRVAPLTDFSPWRLIAWGYVIGRNTPVSFATVEAHPAPTGETVALLRLTSELPTDTDGDGVPDDYDDCPVTADPAQNGNCSGDRPDAGGNGVDAGMNGPNQIMNPGCESGTNGWTGYHSVLSQIPLPRSGMYSCEVCLSQMAADYTIDDSPNTVSMPRVNELYAATAWVKALPGTGSQQIVTLTLREHPTQGVIGQRSEGPGVTLSEQWQQVQSAHTMSVDAFDLDIYIGTNGVAGDCFLVDDIVLVRVL